MEHSITRVQSTDQAERPLAARITLPPAVAIAPDAQARVAAWRADIADQPAGAALALLLADHPAANGLIAGFAESAPYLWDLVRAEPARLLTLLQSDPDIRFEALLAGAARSAAATRD